MDLFVIAIILIANLSLIAVIVLLLRQIGELENKIISRNYTEYISQNRKPSKNPVPNFIQKNLEKAKKNPYDNADDEEM